MINILLIRYLMLMEMLQSLFFCLFVLSFLKSQVYSFTMSKVHDIWVILGNFLYCQKEIPNFGKDFTVLHLRQI